MQRTPLPDLPRSEEISLLHLSKANNHALQRPEGMVVLFLCLRDAGPGHQNGLLLASEKLAQEFLVSAHVLNLIAPAVHIQMTVPFKLC